MCSVFKHLLLLAACALWMTVHASRDRIDVASCTPPRAVMQLSSRPLLPAPSTADSTARIPAVPIARIPAFPFLGGGHLLAHFEKTSTFSIA